jgi:hypothetical protein
LVTREQGKLRAYFRSLFEEIRVHHLAGTLAVGTTVQDLARRLADELPTSLRQDVVYELSGQLVVGIWRLLAQVPEADDPIAALDRQKPDWRAELPLNLEDDIAAAFLNGLVVDAKTVARSFGTSIRFVRSLVRRGSSASIVPSDAIDDWDIVGHLEVPPILRNNQFAGIFPGADIPPRFDLCLVSDKETEMVALGTHRPAHSVVSLERAPHATLSVVGSAAANGRRLLARNAQTRIGPSLGFRGALSLSPLPWVFVPVGDTPDGRRFDLAGEGAMRVRSPNALLVVPADFQVIADGNSVCEAAGNVREVPDRRVMHLSGTAILTDSKGVRCTVSTGVAGAAESREYRLFGVLTDLARDGRPIFLGIPSLATENAEGLTTRINPNEVQWRSTVPNSPWVPVSRECVGDGQLRHINAGQVHFTTRARIVPSGFRIQHRPTSRAEGTIEIVGAGDVRVAVTDVNGVVSRIDETRHDSVSVHLKADGSTASTVTLRLQWARGVIALELPFPANRTGFSSATGETLPPDTAISVSQLSGVRAIAVAPRRNSDFVVEGSYIPGRLALGGDQRRLTLSFEMREDPEMEGVFHLDLGTLQSDVLVLLNSSDELDAAVRLRIGSNRVRDLPHSSLLIRRYDLSLEPSDDRVSLLLPTASLIGRNTDDIDALRVEAMALLAPGDDPTQLRRTGRAAWERPNESFAPGPWLVLGWHGRWCRVRPMLASVAGVPDPTPPGEVARACLEPDPVRRAELFAAAMVALSANPDHVDWELMAGYIRWAAELPPATFDAIRMLSQHAEAAAMAALIVPEFDRDRFDVLWRALRLLPFSWFALPRSAWISAATRWLSSRWRLLEQVENSRGLVDEHSYLPAAKRITADDRLPWLAPVLDGVRSAVLGFPPSQETRRLNKMRSFFLQRYFEAIAEFPAAPVDRRDDLPPVWSLLDYRDVLSSLPEGQRLTVTRTLGLRSEARDGFLNAPAIAATCSVTNAPLPTKAQVELRNIAAFAPDWFHRVYENAYLYALGATL